MDTNVRDWYAVLGASSRDEDKATLRERYQKLVLELHPDKNGSNDSQDQFQLVLEAWRNLSDDETRRKFDASLAVHESASAVYWKTVKRREDMNKEEGDGNFIWTMQCRCGGEFVLEEEEEEAKDDGEVRSPMILDCDTCSLSILVKDDQS